MLLIKIALIIGALEGGTKIYQKAHDYYIFKNFKKIELIKKECHTHIDNQIKTLEKDSNEYNFFIDLKNEVPRIFDNPKNIAKIYETIQTFKKNKDSFTILIQFLRNPSEDNSLNFANTLRKYLKTSTVEESAIYCITAFSLICQQCSTMKCRTQYDCCSTFTKYGLYVKPDPKKLTSDEALKNLFALLALPFILTQIFK